jgi:hypothetical protein
MLKKFAVSLLTLAFLTLGAGPAFGAPDAAKLAELKTLHQQMYELKIQMIDKRVEAGLLEKDKAAQFKASMERHQKQFEEDWAKGEYNFGKKHGKNCDKKFKGNSQSAPETKSSPSTD